jgi:hypothetical protein
LWTGKSKTIDAQLTSVDQLKLGEIVDLTIEQQDDRERILSLHLLDAYSSKLAIRRERPVKKGEDEVKRYYWVNINTSNLKLDSTVSEKRTQADSH